MLGCWLVGIANFPGENFERKKGIKAPITPITRISPKEASKATSQRAEKAINELVRKEEKLTAFAQYDYVDDARPWVQILSLGVDL